MPKLLRGRIESQQSHPPRFQVFSVHPEVEVSCSKSRQLPFFKLLVHPQLTKCTSTSRWSVPKTCRLTPYMPRFITTLQSSRSKPQRPQSNNIQAPLKKGGNGEHKIHMLSKSQRFLVPLPFFLFLLLIFGNSSFVCLSCSAM